MQVRITLILIGFLALTACGNLNTPDEEEVTPIYTEPVEESADTVGFPEEIEDEREAQVDLPSLLEIEETPADFDLENINYYPQIGQLVANDPNSQINLRSMPSIDSELKGYGLVGDKVRLLGAFWWGAGRFPWYEVKFEGSGAEGWVRGDFIARPDVTPPDIEDIEAKANLAGFTLQEAQEFIDVFEKHMPEVEDYIVVPSYVPANFEVETFGVDATPDKNYSISYIGPSNQCFLIYAFSGPAGGGPVSIEIIPVVSKALGSTKIHY